MCIRDRRLGGRTLAVVNVVGSSIARESDDVLYTWAGPEIAVATTKAYSTQLVLMDLVGLYLADVLGTVEPAEYSAIVDELAALPEKLENVLAHVEDIQYFASRYFNHDSIFFIGRNLDYAMGMEGSLKLKEDVYKRQGENMRDLIVLKGGPGVGKSTFMRCIGKQAEEKGLQIEYIRCSGDPDSLDAVCLPQLGVAVADGTAPHVVEPAYPAAVGRYVNLGQFYNVERLKERRREIVACTDGYQACLLYTSRCV